MDYLEKCPTKGTEWRGGSAGMNHSPKNNHKIKSSPGNRYGRGLSCFEKSPLKNVVHIRNLEPHFKNNGDDSGDCVVVQRDREVERRRTMYNHSCDTRFSTLFINCVLGTKLESTCRYRGDFRNVDSEPRNGICYDTCTYFDKPHLVDTGNLKERYTKEIEQLRGKLRELKGEQQQLHFQRRRLLDDVGLSPKEMLLKTNTNATVNNSSNSSAKKIASEVKSKISIQKIYCKTLDFCFRR